MPCPLPRFLVVAQCVDLSQLGPSSSSYAHVPGSHLAPPAVLLLSPTISIPGLHRDLENREWPRLSSIKDQAEPPMVFYVFPRDTFPLSVNKKGPLAGPGAVFGREGLSRGIIRRRERERRHIHFLSLSPYARPIGYYPTEFTTRDVDGDRQGRNTRPQHKRSTSHCTYSPT